MLRSEAIVVVAFGVVMLIVPWLLAPGPGQKAETRSGLELGPGGRRSLFSSHRERLLWTWVLVILVAIYSSLGPVQQLAALLRERGLLGITSAGIMVLVAGIIAVRWARTRPGRREIGVGSGVVAVYLTALFRIPVPEERTHLFEYGLVAILMYQALSERRRNGWRVRAQAVLAVLATALLGWLDEGIQSLLPNRVYDLRDVGFNALAGLMAILASVFMAWARTWDLRKDRGRRSDSSERR
jgi:hypothetical protein